MLKIPLAAAQGQIKVWARQGFNDLDFMEPRNQFKIFFLNAKVRRGLANRLPRTCNYLRVALLLPSAICSQRLNIPYLFLLEYF